MYKQNSKKKRQKSLETLHPHVTRWRFTFTLGNIKSFGLSHQLCHKCGRKCHIDNANDSSDCHASRNQQEQKRQSFLVLALHHFKTSLIVDPVKQVLLLTSIQRNWLNLIRRVNETSFGNVTAIFLKASPAESTATHFSLNVVPLSAKFGVVVVVPIPSFVVNLADFLFKSFFGYGASHIQG